MLVSSIKYLFSYLLAYLFIYLLIYYLFASVLVSHFKKPLIWTAVLLWGIVYCYTE